jgi:hypothetical protein
MQGVYGVLEVECEQRLYRIYGTDDSQHESFMNVEGLGEHAVLSCPAKTCIVHTKNTSYVATISNGKGSLVDVCWVNAQLHCG